jgi:hypothetical protein
VRAGRVWAGVLLALLGHAVWLGVVALTATTDGVGLWIGTALLGQLVLFTACLTVGIVLLVRHERGIGLGLLIGWAAGVVVVPIMGYVAANLFLRG